VQYLGKVFGGAGKRACSNAAGRDFTVEFSEYSSIGDCPMQRAAYWRLTRTKSAVALDCEAGLRLMRRVVKLTEASIEQATISGRRERSGGITDLHEENIFDGHWKRRWKLPRRCPLR
jgi:hypothetical protein